MVGQIARDARILSDPHAPEPAKAEALLQWKATHSLEEIVSTAWNWMEHHRTSATQR